MVKNFDEVQQFGKGGVEATMKSFGAFSKSVQAIATEAADYSKKAFEDGTAAAEKLMGAKTLDKAVEVQSDYFKKTYEAFVSQATKVTELYADLAKEAYKPFESYAARAGAK
jgi:phasin family protein